MLKKKDFKTVCIFVAIFATYVLVSFVKFENVNIHWQKTTNRSRKSKWHDYRSDKSTIPYSSAGSSHKYCGEYETSSYNPANGSLSFTFLEIFNNLCHLRTTLIE